MTNQTDRQTYIVCVHSSITDSYWIGISTDVVTTFQELVVNSPVDVSLIHVWEDCQMTDMLDFRYINQHNIIHHSWYNETAYKVLRVFMKDRERKETTDKWLWEI